MIKEVDGLIVIKYFGRLRMDFMKSNFRGR